MTTQSIWVKVMELKEILKQFIDERGLSQKQLAGMIGVSAAEVSYVISGRHIPKWETLVKIANTIGVPVEELKERPELTLPKPVQRFFLHDWPNLPESDKDFLLAMLRLIERANHKRRYTVPVSPDLAHVSA